MDRAGLEAKLNRLLALRGDPVRGLQAPTWAEALDGTDPDLLLRAALDTVRTLLVPEWADRRRDDKRPQRALDAVEAWLATRSAEAAQEAKAAAKACTAARRETFGDDHRVPEAARHVAWAVSARDTETIAKALAAVEQELLARIALTAEYHRGPEQRRAIVDVLRRVLLPREAAPEAAGPKPADGGPIPYSPDTRFELGQRVLHKKFGEVIVASVGETTIDVDLGDGTRKRLAHRGPT